MFLPCLKVLHKLNSKTFAFLHTRLHCCKVGLLHSTLTFSVFWRTILDFNPFLAKNTMYVKIDIWIKNCNQIPTFLLIDVVLESAKPTNQDDRTKNLTHPCCFFSFCQFPIASLCTLSRPSKISEKNWSTKMKPFLTIHLWYKAMLKV